MKFLILFLVAVLISSIGFKKFVWFISLGYGFSIAGIGVALLVMFCKDLTVVTAIMSVMLVIYGCRLGGYLLIREKKSASYQKTMKNDIKDGSDMKLFPKLCCWLSCALLYVLEASPVLFRLQSGNKDNGCAIAGCVIMICGIVLESAADITKNSFKKIQSAFAMWIFSKSSDVRIISEKFSLGQVCLFPASPHTKMRLSGFAQ